MTVQQKNIRQENVVTHEMLNDFNNKTIKKHEEQLKRDKKSKGLFDRIPLTYYFIVFIISLLLIQLLYTK